MLPLDILDKSAKDVLRENGISPESIDAAVFTDLDRDKKYCSAWLAFSKSEGSVFYFSTDGKIFEKYWIERIVILSADPFCSPFSTHYKSPVFHLKYCMHKSRGHASVI